MTVHDLELRCRACGCRNDATANATPGDEAAPSDGEATVCWRCSCISIFVGTPPTALRELTDEELRQLAHDPTITSLQQVRPVASTPQDALRRAGLLR